MPIMKIKELTGLMNDHGTNPRIRVLRHGNEYTSLDYEGKPNNISKEIAELKVFSFTVLGTGFIEIHS